MKVLVATSETDPRDGGFSFTVPGELLGPPSFVCANPDCGSCWSFAGVASSLATTLAAVADRPELDGTAVTEIEGLAWSAEAASGHEVDELLVLWVPDANDDRFEVWHLDDWIDKYGLNVNPRSNSSEEEGP